MSRSNSCGEILQWYPVYTFAKAEKKAAEALANLGYEVYLPLQRSLKQWSDRKKWVEEPFLKSYLFVRIEEKDVKQVLMIKGIARFLYFSGKVASMPQRQIDELKLLLTSPYQLEITEEDLLAGEKIKIKGGPLKGLFGEIISHRSQKQLIIRLENLGYSIIVYMPSSGVERF